VFVLFTQVGYGKEVLSRGRYAEVDTDTRGFTHEEAEVGVVMRVVQPHPVATGVAVRRYENSPALTRLALE
jgi:hypothetical protein